jgi:hypothetical protein
MQAEHGARSAEASNRLDRLRKEEIQMAKTKNTVAVLAGQLIAGTNKHFPTTSSLAFGGGTFTPAEVEASLQTLSDLRTAVNDAKTATKAKLADEQAQAPSLRTQMSAYVTYVKATFGNSPDVLADFGLTPNKVKAPLTLDQKAAAAAKRTATRAARHTMGSKQKKGVKGTITTIITPTSSTAPQPVAPSPVASAPSQGTSAAAAPRTP